MKTPKNFSDNLKKRVITKEMLLQCLFSVNKRAKNCRDQERLYKRGYDRYNNEEQYRVQKEQYYVLKERLLSVLTPDCIHREFIRYEKERIYDYEPEYETYKKQSAFVHENSYWDNDFNCEVYFGDIELKDSPIYNYYLFYNLGEYSFHTPISNPLKYALPVVDIDRLSTNGKDINDLISMQFVRKVIELLDSADYSLELTDETEKDKA